MAKTSHDRAQKEISALRQDIEKHNYQYHVADNPLITDAEYDRLFRRLQELEREYPELATPDSPTQKVGAPPLEKFSTVQHTIPMLSLNNAADEEELRDFQERIQRFLKHNDVIEYAVEPKVDGRRWSWFTSTANLPSVPPAATALTEKISRKTSRPFVRYRSPCAPTGGRFLTDLKFAAKCSCRARRFKK